MRALLSIALLVGCGGSPARPVAPTVKAAEVYTDRTIAAELAAIVRAHPGRIAVEKIGTTSEQRDIVVARIGTRGPAVIVLFGLHPDEHDMPMLAMRMIRSAVADRALDRRLYIVPLANPDGTAFDLASDTPLTWRKNRRGEGANLNRNWGAHWNAGKVERMAAEYPGDAAFSEPETRALRDFIAAHPEIVGFVDAHSGASSFNQGFVLYPYSYTEEQALPPAEEAKYRDLAGRFAKNLTCAVDERPAFEAVQSREVRARVIAFLEKAVPPEHRAAAIASVPASTAAAGASIDWAHDVMKRPAIGLEIARPFQAETPAQFAAETAKHLDRCAETYYRAIASFARELQ